MQKIAEWPRRRSRKGWHGAVILCFRLHNTFFYHCRRILDIILLLVPIQTDRHGHRHMLERLVVGPCHAPCLALLFALLSCLALCSVLLLLKWLTCCCYFYSYVACSNACSCWCGCWCCCSCGLLLHWHLTFDIDYSIQQRHQRTTTAAASHSGGHVSNILIFSSSY